MAARTTSKPDESAASAPEAGADDKAEKEGIAATVREVLAEELGKLFDGGKADIVDSAETDPGPEPTKPLSPREEESRMERVVGRAVAKLLEQDQEAKPGPKTSEPEVEPVQAIKRATRAVWGEW